MSSKSPETTPEPPIHPVQTQYRGRSGECPQTVTLKAYEVYRHLYGDQEALQWWMRAISAVRAGYPELVS